LSDYNRAGAAQNVGDGGRVAEGGRITRNEGALLAIKEMGDVAGLQGLAQK